MLVCKSKPHVCLDSTILTMLSCVIWRHNTYFNPTDEHAAIYPHSDRNKQGRPVKQFDRPSWIGLLLLIQPGKEYVTWAMSQCCGRHGLSCSNASSRTRIHDPWPSQKQEPASKQALVGESQPITSSCVCDFSYCRDPHSYYAEFTTAGVFKDL